MPRNSSGIYTAPANSVNPAIPDTEINATDFNAMLTDLSEALSESIASDGVTTVTANIPLAGFKLTGVGLATATGDALSYGRAATVTALTATTFNGNTWTAGTGTLTLGASKTLAVSNTLTFAGTDGSSVNFGAGGTVLYSGGSYVSSIAGTANEITASAATGAVTLSLPSALTFTGKTVTGGTFSGPTLSGTVAGTPTFSGALTFSAALTYGGVTLSNSVTGTGSMVLSSSPIITGTGTYAGASISLANTNPGAVSLTSADGSPNSIRLLGQTTRRNWQFGNQINVNDAFEITPSTGNGGSTFSTPAISIVGSTNVATVASLAMGNAYTGGAPAATGYVLITCNGVAYKFLVST